LAGTLKQVAVYMQGVHRTYDTHETPHVILSSRHVCDSKAEMRTPARTTTVLRAAGRMATLGAALNEVQGRDTFLTEVMVKDILIVDSGDVVLVNFDWICKWECLFTFSGLKIRFEVYYHHFRVVLIFPESG
jgi:hypothetical protein